MAPRVKKIGASSIGDGGGVRPDPPFVGGAMLIAMSAALAATMSFSMSAAFAATMPFFMSAALSATMSFLMSAALAATVFFSRPPATCGTAERSGLRCAGS